MYINLSHVCPIAFLILEWAFGIMLNTNVNVKSVLKKWYYYINNHDIMNIKLIILFIPIND